MFYNSWRDEFKSIDLCLPMWCCHAVFTKLEASVIMHAEVNLENTRLAQHSNINQSNSLYQQTRKKYDHFNTCTKNLRQNLTCTGDKKKKKATEEKLP
jgi:hypothetical protein